MAALDAIRASIGTTIGTAIPSLSMYGKVPDVLNLPAVIVVPTDTDFVVAMGRGLDKYTFSLFVLVANREAGLAQDELDAFVTGAGAKSVRQAVWNNKSLGLTAGGAPDADAHVSGMSEYGTQFEAAGVELVGAILTLIVHTSGNG